MSKWVLTLNLFIVGWAANAQSTAPVAFEVASIKPTPPERQNQLRTDYCPKGGNFSVSGTPVMWSLAYAFRLKDYQVSGAPSWLNAFDSAYDMDGKPEHPVNDEQCRLMVQALFADRFRLKAHRETKEFSAYLLTLRKIGAKLREGGGVRLNGSVQVDGSGTPEWPDGWPISRLASYLSDVTGRPVVDQTGLGGMYGITLTYSRNEGADGRPSIFTAVQEQRPH